MRAFFVLAFLASGCAATGAAPAPVFPVRQSLVIWDSAEWQRSPWYRSSDLYSNGPFYVLIADGNRACVLPAQAWMRVHRDQLHSCETGWRSPRLRSLPGVAQ